MSLFAFPAAGAARSSPDTAFLPELELLLASPRGFCAGVRRAIDAVEDALRTYGAPVYVRRPIVHNLAVVRSLEAEGAIFVEELDQVPSGSVVILSAHGVAPAVREEASARRLIVHDAVCPLVAKVNREVERHYADGRHVVLIGHDGHPEVEGTLGRLPAGAATLVRTLEEIDALTLPREHPVAYAVQTTFALSDAAEIVQRLAARFSDVAGPRTTDICYATSNRQTAAEIIAIQVEALIVIGESFSSNANRLAEVGRQLCKSVQLVAEPNAIDWDKIPAGGTIGVTAAASTPEESVNAVLEKLGTRYRLHIREIAVAEETQTFKPVEISRGRLPAPSAEARRPLQPPSE
jgi:4-hydroxy-3-methylbut-2-enyl diphosphate reductase